MRRREFIAGLGGAAAAAWPFAARAQQRQPAMPVIGFLNSASADEYAPQVAAFGQGLQETGYIEGRNVAIEFRWAEDQIARLAELAADLVRRRVAVIVTENATTPAARAATSTIPIVFVSGADPVQAGHVTSLNRPGGNVTGVTFAADPLNAKRLELLHELVPKPALIAVLMYTNSPTLEGGLQDTESAARALGRQILILKAGTESEIDAAFATIVQAGAGALFVGPGSFYYSHRRQLAALAARHALPTSFSLYEYVAAGGLMSYGTSITDAYRRGGHYVGRILKGDKPGEMPVELPTRYKLVLNLATAKALRLEIPAKLLALADEVIE
jgi:putative tryptophan/tyrosine transport system substrate-binding protein